MLETAYRKESAAIWKTKCDESMKTDEVVASGEYAFAIGTGYLDSTDQWHDDSIKRGIDSNVSRNLIARVEPFLEYLQRQLINGGFFQCRESIRYGLG